MSTHLTAPNGDSDRVSEIRQRLEAATPGPWTAASQNGVAVVIAEQPGYSAPVAVLAGARFTIKRRHANATLIAAAPADLAWLLSRLAAVEAERDELRAKLDRTWREATPAFQRLHAALDETGREVEAPAGDGPWRHGWAEGYTVACTTLRRALSGTTDRPS